MESGKATEDRRILRLALGVTLTMAVSQAVDWPLSFVSPIIVGVLLSLPLPIPSLKLTLIVMGCLVGTLLCSYALLPSLYHAPVAGILLIGLAIFGSFLITASGGPALIGTLLTLSLTLLTTIGSVDINAFIQLTEGFVLSAFIGFIFVWLSHVLLPDRQTSVAAAANPKAQKPARPEHKEAVRSAFRSLVIVFPVAVLFLFLNSSTAYTVIMIKIATMGQQATSSKSRELGRELLDSTFWGGVGAIIAWLAMKAFPSLALYSLLVALAALIYGKRIFAGKGMHPRATMWQYAFITMITVLAPTVGSMASGQSASDKFWFRLVQFLFIAFYGWLAVTVFDSFYKAKPSGKAATPSPESSTS